MFYRTKLNIHNLTFYILKTKRAMNCLWTEVSGGLVASVSTTIHLDHLEKCIRENPGVDTILAWCDGCCYQNKSACEASGVRRIAAKHNITIIFKYLVVGHTFIECNSVHRCIEDV